MQINRISLFKNQNFTSQLEKNPKSNKSIPDTTSAPEERFNEILKALSASVQMNEMHIRVAEFKAQRTLSKAQEMEEEAIALTDEVRFHAEDIIDEAKELYKHLRRKFGAKMAKAKRNGASTVITQTSPSGNIKRKITFGPKGDMIIEETNENGTNKYEWHPESDVLVYYEDYKKSEDGAETSKIVLELHNNELRAFIKDQEKHPDQSENSKESLILLNMQNRKLMIYMADGEISPDKSTKYSKFLKAFDGKIIKYSENHEDIPKKSEKERLSIEFTDGKIKSYTEGAAFDSSGTMTKGKIFSFVG